MTNQGFETESYNVYTGTDGELDYLLTVFDDGLTTVATRTAGSNDRWGPPVTLRDTPIEEPVTMRGALDDLMAMWRRTHYAPYGKAADDLQELLDRLDEELDG